MRVPDSSPILDENRRAPLVLGLGSGGKLPRHFQTPVLHWISFSLGETYCIAKPREDGRLETVFGDPLKAVSEGVT